MGKGKETSARRSRTVMATYAPPDLFLIHFWASARYSSASLARLAVRAAIASSDSRYLFEAALPPSDSRYLFEALFEAALPPSDSSYFWKKASESTEREPGELRAPTQTAARAGRAVTLLARAVKNGVHSPLWWLFPPRTLRISGKKRASQRRDSHGQLHAPCCRRWPSCTLAVLHPGRAARPTCAGHKP